LPLQNRVDPFGDIHAVAARGLFTGNRGIIHDPDTRTLLSRRWALRAWLICELHWKDRRREPMGRNAPGGGAGWTELFFLDEVTALAAGHRPCFYCRRERATAFLRCYGVVSGMAGARAPALDAQLHGERRASSPDGWAAAASLDGTAIGTLPDGTMVAAAGKAFAIRGGAMLPWSFEGYAPPADMRELAGGTIRLITPRTTVKVLEAGYAPVWHPSAALP
jgi:hypothetical protein